MRVWGLTLPVMGLFALNEAWYSFYFLAAGMTVFYSLFPLIPGRGRQHAIGAELMFFSLVASVVMQDYFNDSTPLIAHQALDGFMGAAFLWITATRKAIWSMCCVLIHAGMAVLTYTQYTYHTFSDGAYLTRLNLLYLAALLVINIAVMAGRQRAGESLDGFFVRRLRGWSFTGLRLPRIYPSRAKA